MGRLLILPLLGLLALGYAAKCPTQRASPGREILCYTSMSDVKSFEQSICRCTTLVHQGHDLQELTSFGLNDLRESLKKINPAIQFVININDERGSLRTSAVARHKAIAKIATILNEVDGIELNITAGTKERLVHFIQGLKDEMTRKSRERRILLSLPTKAELLAKQFDIKSLTKYVDLFTIPTHYLMDNEEINRTFHPSRLMGLFDLLNTDSLVDLIHGLGAEKRKIAISLPASGYKFILKDTEDNAPRASAVNDYPMVIGRNEICDIMKEGEWTIERDEDLTAPYAFKDLTWIAFEDKISAAIKGKYVLLRDLAGLAVHDIENDRTTDCGRAIAEEIYHSFSDNKRKTREAVLSSLENDIYNAESTHPGKVKSSDFRISRIVDTEGKIHAIRENMQTEFTCPRQGYFVHPKSCNRFYRCVKFNQAVEDFSIFEFDCPAGLAFDERTEVCVWPGSLSEGSPCPGSSEIAPSKPRHFRCPAKGYYADTSNCRFFFACVDLGHHEMTAYEFRCPYGLVFDENKVSCEWPWLVPSCGGTYEHHGGGYGGYAGYDISLGAGKEYGGMEYGGHGGSFGGGHRGMEHGGHGGSFGGGHRGMEHGGHGGSSGGRHGGHDGSSGGGHKGMEHGEHGGEHGRHDGSSGGGHKGMKHGEHGGSAGDRHEAGKDRGSDDKKHPQGDYDYEKPGDHDGGEKQPDEGYDHEEPKGDHNGEDKHPEGGYEVTERRPPDGYDYEKPHGGDDGGKQPDGGYDYEKPQGGEVDKKHPQDGYDDGKPQDGEDDKKHPEDGYDSEKPEGGHGGGGEHPEGGYEVTEKNPGEYDYEKPHGGEDSDKKLPEGGYEKPQEGEDDNKKYPEDGYGYKSSEDGGGEVGIHSQGGYDYGKPESGGDDDKKQPGDGYDFEKPQGGYDDKNQGEYDYEKPQGGDGKDQGGYDYEKSEGGDDGKNEDGHDYEKPEGGDDGKNQDGHDYEKPQGGDGTDQGGYDYEKSQGGDDGKNQGEYDYEKPQGGDGKDQGGYDYEQSQGGDDGKNQGEYDYEKPQGGDGKDQGGYDYEKPQGGDDGKNQGEYDYEKPQGGDNGENQGGYDFEKPQDSDDGKNQVGHDYEKPEGGDGKDQGAYDYEKSQGGNDDKMYRPQYATDFTPEAPGVFTSGYTPTPGSDSTSTVHNGYVKSSDGSASLTGAQESVYISGQGYQSGGVDIAQPGASGYTATPSPGGYRGDAGRFTENFGFGAVTHGFKPSSASGSITTGDSTSGGFYTQGGKSGTVISGASQQGSISSGITQPGYVHTQSGAPGYVVSEGVKTIYGGSDAQTNGFGTTSAGVHLDGGISPGSIIRGSSTPGVVLTGQTAQGAASFDQSGASRGQTRIPSNPGGFPSSGSRITSGSIIRGSSTPGVALTGQTVQGTLSFDQRGASRSQTQIPSIPGGFSVIHGGSDAQTNNALGTPSSSVHLGGGITSGSIIRGSSTPGVVLTGQTAPGVASFDQSGASRGQTRIPLNPGGFPSSASGSSATGDSTSEGFYTQGGKSRTVISGVSQQGNIPTGINQFGYVQTQNGAPGYVVSEGIKKIPGGSITQTNAFGTTPAGIHFGGGIASGSIIRGSSSPGVALNGQTAQEGSSFDQSGGFYTQGGKSGTLINGVSEQGSISTGINQPGYVYTQSGTPGNVVSERVKTIHGGSDAQTNNALGTPSSSVHLGGGITSGSIIRGSSTPGVALNGQTVQGTSSFDQRGASRSQTQIPSIPGGFSVIPGNENYGNQAGISFGGSGSRITSAGAQYYPNLGGSSHETVGAGSPGPVLPNQAGINSGLASGQPGHKYYTNEAGGIGQRQAGVTDVSSVQSETQFHPTEFGIFGIKTGLDFPSAHSIEGTFGSKMSFPVNDLPGFRDMKPEQYSSVFSGSIGLGQMSVSGELRPTFSMGPSGISSGISGSLNVNEGPSSTGSQPGHAPAGPGSSSVSTGGLHQASYPAKAQQGYSSAQPGNQYYPNHSGIPVAGPKLSYTPSIPTGNDNELLTHHGTSFNAKDQSVTQGISPGTTIQYYPSQPGTRVGPQSSFTIPSKGPGNQFFPNQASTPNYLGNPFLHPASPTSSGNQFHANEAGNSDEVPIVPEPNDHEYKTNEYHDNGGRGTIRYNNGLVTHKYTKDDLNRGTTFQTFTTPAIPASTQAPLDELSTPSVFTKTGPTKTGITTAQLGGSGTYTVGVGPSRPAAGPDEIGENAFSGGVKRPTIGSSLSVTGKSRVSGYSYTKAPVNVISSIAPTAKVTPAPFFNIQVDGPEVNGALTDSPAVNIHEKDQGGYHYEKPQGFDDDKNYRQLSTPAGFTNAGATKTGITSQLGGSGTYTLGVGSSRPTAGADGIGGNTYSGGLKRPILVPSLGLTDNSRVSGYSYTETPIDVTSSIVPTAKVTPAPFFNIQVGSPSVTGSLPDSPAVNTFPSKPSAVQNPRPFSLSSTAVPIGFTTGPLDTYRTTAYEAAKVPLGVSTVRPVLDTGYKTVISSTPIPVAVETGGYKYNEEVSGGAKGVTDNYLNVGISLEGFSTPGPEFSTTGSVISPGRASFNVFGRPGATYQPNRYEKTGRPDYQRNPFLSGLPVTPTSYESTSGEEGYVYKDQNTVFEQKIPQGKIPAGNKQSPTFRPQVNINSAFNRPSSPIPQVTYRPPTNPTHRVTYRPPLSPTPQVTYPPPTSSTLQVTYRPPFQVGDGFPRPTKGQVNSAAEGDYNYSKPTVKYISTPSPSISYSTPRPGTDGTEVKKLMNNNRGTVKYRPSNYDETSGISKNQNYPQTSEYEGKTRDHSGSTYKTGSFVEKIGSTRYPSTPSPLQVTTHQPAITTYSGNYGRPSTPGYGVSSTSSELARPKSNGKIIVKYSDLHPILLGKLGAECTCKSDPFDLSRYKKPLRIDSSKGSVDLRDYDESNIYVDLEASRESGDYKEAVTEYQSTISAPRISNYETPVVAEFTGKSTKPRRPSLGYLPIASSSVKSFGSTTLSPLRVSASDIEASVSTQVRRGRSRGGKSLSLPAKNSVHDDQRTPTSPEIGVLELTPEGRAECARAGLFRHPKHCNKFYVCHWDEWKKKFTLDVFDCPVYLTFNSNAGACNWPSKGPACQDDNLLV